MIALFGSSNGKIESSAVAYDIVNSVWMNVDMRGLIPNPTVCHTTSVIGNELYIFGGKDEANSLHNEIYKGIMCIDSNHTSIQIYWKQIPAKGPLPSPRVGHSAAVYRDRFIIITGGENDLKEQMFNDIWAFDTTISEWFQVTLKGGDLYKETTGVSTFVHNNKLYMFGGMNKNKENTNDLQVICFDGKFPDQFYYAPSNKSVLSGKNGLLEIENSENVLFASTLLSEQPTGDVSVGKESIAANCKQESKVQMNDGVSPIFVEGMAMAQKWILGSFGNVIEFACRDQNSATKLDITVKSYSRASRIGIEFLHQEIDKLSEQVSKKEEMSKEPQLSNVNTIMSSLLEEEATEKVQIVDVIEVKDNGIGIAASQFPHFLTYFGPGIVQEGGIDYMAILGSVKLSLLRIADSFLMISKSEDKLCVGLVSLPYMKEANSNSVTTPYAIYSISRSENGGVYFTPDTSNSLCMVNTILYYTPQLFAGEAKLLEHCKSDSFATGTHLFIYNFSHREEPMQISVESSRKDIIIRYKECEKLNMIDFSLRTYVKFLFLKHPQVEITILGKKVNLNNPLAYFKDKYEQSNAHFPQIAMQNIELGNASSVPALVFDSSSIASDAIKQFVSKKKIIRNGVLIYRGNRLIQRHSTQLGEITLITKKLKKRTRDGKSIEPKIFAVSGLVILPSTFQLLPTQCVKCIIRISTPMRDSTS